MHTVRPAGKAAPPAVRPASDAALPSPARRKAWIALAQLAQREGDAARAAECFEAAARLP